MLLSQSGNTKGTQWSDWVSDSNQMSKVLKLVSIIFPPRFIQMSSQIHGEISVHESTKM